MVRGGAGTEPRVRATMPIAFRHRLRRSTPCCAVAIHKGCGHRHRPIFSRRPHQPGLVVTQRWNVHDARCTALLYGDDACIVSRPPRGLGLTIAESSRDAFSAADLTVTENKTRYHMRTDSTYAGNTDSLTTLRDSSTAGPLHPSTWGGGAVTESSNPSLKMN